MKFFNLAVSASLLQAVNLGLPFLFTILAVKHYGITAFGAYTTIFSAIALLSAVVEYGLTTYGIASGAHHKQEGNGYSEIFICITKAKFLLFIIVTPFYFLVLHFFEISQINILGMVSGYLYLLGIVLNSTWYTFHAGKVKDVFIVTLLVRILSIVLLLLISYTKENNVNYAIALNSFSFLLIGYASYKISVINLRINAWDSFVSFDISMLMSSVFVPARSLALTSVFVIFYTAVPILVVSQVLGPTAAGVIGLADRVVRAVQSVLSGISSAALARSSTMSMKENARVTKIQIILYLVSACLLLTFCLALQYFYNWSNFASHTPIFMVYSILLGVGGCSSVLSVYYFVRRHLYKAQAFITLTGAVTSPILVYLASNYYGMLGASLSVLATELLLLILILIYSRKILNNVS